MLKFPGPLVHSEGMGAFVTLTIFSPPLGKASIDHLEGFVSRFAPWFPEVLPCPPPPSCLGCTASLPFSSPKRLVLILYVLSCIGPLVSGVGWNFFSAIHLYCCKVKMCRCGTWIFALPLPLLFVCLQEGFTAVLRAALNGHLTVLRSLVEQYGGNVLHRTKVKWLHTYFLWCGNLRVLGTATCAMTVKVCG